MSHERNRGRALGAGALIAVAALAAIQDGYARDQPAQSTFLGCRRSSWTPEVHGYYGDPKAVLAKLGALDAKLPERRVYMYLAESDSKAQLAFYEGSKTDPVEWQVLRWSGTAAQATALRGKVEERILALKGNECVGEATKEIVMSLSGVKTEKPKAPPRNSEEAFGAEIKGMGEQSYVRVTLFLLC